LRGNFDRQQAVGAMKDILQTNPDVNAVFCANDQMALGAVESISSRDLQEQILLVGFGGALEATQKILSGDMDATASQDPYATRKRGVETAVAELRDKPVKRKINTGAQLIDKNNAERYFERVRERLGGAGSRADGLDSSRALFASHAVDAEHAFGRCAEAGGRDWLAAPVATPVAALTQLLKCPFHTRLGCFEARADADVG
jgi:hypothetical protein